MQKLRNIAIIAHVDHGKTTLVDKMILAGHILRDNQQTGDLILDNNDLERERGITILSKNVSVIYKDYKINIIDTPGHADFGGEVERVLNMCDGVLLLVDAFEGTMPQTRFVLQKALALGKKPIVVINKVDKPNCRPEVVNEQVFDLMFSLNATEEQLDYKTIYGSAKQGWMSHKWNERTDSIVPLLDAIIDEIPEPAQVEGTPQMLITSLEYSSYTGRIAVGKVTRGSLKAGQNVTLAKRDGVTMQKTKIRDLMVFEGLGKKKVDEVPCGEICAIMGIEGFEIGDTICDYENPEPLPPIAIDEPTMSMLFTINNSPFFGKDGKYVTSRHIKERLDRELEKNLALRVTPGPSADSFIVYGRGVLHLSVLIETMRREGYELQVGQPHVIIKEIDGKKCEPIEEMTVDCPDEYSGTVIDLVTRRKGTLTNMASDGERTRLEFNIPSRGHHRAALEHAHGDGRRGDHDAPPEGFRAVGRRDRDADQRFDHLGRDGHGLRLLDRQAAGPRAFLHQPDGPGLRGAGDRRTHAAERHHGERHQVEAVDQHAGVGFGRQGGDRTAEDLYAGRGAGVYPG